MSASTVTVLAGERSGVFAVMRAIVRRVDRRGLAAAIALAAVAGCGIVLGEQDVWDQPVAIIAGRMVHNTVTALCMLVGVLAADEMVDRGARRLPAYAMAVVGAAILGSLLGHAVRETLGLPDNLPPITDRFPLMRRIEVAFVAVFLGGLATFAHVSARNALAARRRQAQAETARANAERRTLQSELQALQARIEPRFLFDTLDRIRRLYPTDAHAAGGMLGDLIAYLRAALPHLRESESTVARELELARAFLDIVARSMVGLIVEVRLDPSVRDAPLPALVLLPLVQRALAEGDQTPLRLSIAALAGDTTVCLRIDTSTAAFRSASPALEQLVERLRALYGDRASVRVEGAASGSRALVEIPLEAGRHDRSP